METKKTIKPMKIFQTIQKNMRHSGFIRDQNAFNKTQTLVIFKSIVFLTLQFVYLLRVANTPRQYMDSIFMSTVGFLIVISHADIAIKTAKIFDLIDAFEQTINESECISLELE